ncbi:pyruvate kinase [candidate division WWE3 bacterium]|jgi:pyruvate kinase|uniref:Pyruvate kinase n=1 Tax=candidate division WWE3 bacterium TaxID=2053526 RepID=A0A3A4ZGH0_UNCKA|nr:MAG: pyruvate kinase [candidate division WWE3 bacterium]
MHSGKHTKIVATLGPASEDPETITHMIKAGVNVFRFNMKHNTNEWHVEKIKIVRNISKELNIPVGVLIDLQGPEIRIETQKDIQVEKGDHVFFVNDFSEVKELSRETSLTQEPKVVKISEKIVLDTLDIEDQFSIDDGFLEFEIVECFGNGFIAKSLDNGVISDHKSLNLIGKDVALPSLVEKDLERLDIAAKAAVDFVALSYVRTQKDVVELKKEMSSRNLKAKIVAKIESEKGIDNIDEIIDESDVVMVARGDLGVEMPIERIAYLQKTIINKCRSKNKQVIVATQMLQSMTVSSRPTRAEATDVSNAVYDGADAVMLSAESATGKYPVKSVEVMRRILKFNETHSQVFEVAPHNKDQTNTIVKAAVSILEFNWAKIDKVIVFTETGYTANALSSYRIKIPVVAVSEDVATVESLTIDYGVHPAVMKFPHGQFEFSSVEDQLLGLELVKKGERVLVIHGRQWKDPGKTNALFILQV